MKQTEIQAFCRAATTAPALNRGLAVLAALGEESALSLDDLAVRLCLPKASVFRLLGTLQQIGMVRKTADKRYEALWGLQPLGDARTHQRRRIEAKMPALCSATGCTVEWYEPSEAGMDLVRQINPDSELRVQARPGFVRKWGEEFEAVARLGYAFAREAPPVAPAQMYVDDGVLKKISRQEAVRLIAKAREDKAAGDLPFNSNSVRRCAVGVFDDAGETFFGVLALAECFRFSRKPSAQSTFLKQLKTALNLF